MLGEHLLPGPFRMDGGTIEERSHAGARIGVTENVEVLFRAIVFAGKAQ
jgi:hypothetical protein